MGRVLDLLREAHPRQKFIDIHDLKTRKTTKRNKGETRRGATGTIQALIKGEIDILVVDAREMPLRFKPNVELSAVVRRSNPFDVLISREGLILDDQPDKACLAVSNPVKRGQLLYYRPDLSLLDESGEFETLYRMMIDERIDGFVYAASDVEALNQQDKVAEVFTTSVCTPVAGQGALGILVRKDNKDARAVLSVIDDPASATEVELERQFLKYVARDGKGPVGVLGKVERDEFQVEATIAAPDGSEKVSGVMRGRLGEESNVLEKLASELLESGGKKIIKTFK